ncbi:MAG: copper homeostasis protein CutC [Pirellulaceae bacterium]|nr:copper homeostasis protein CutC [Pirellulaceae bacterium]
MLEVCVDSLLAAREAAQAGAQRLELCSALDVGGVTPCHAFIQAVMQQTTCPVVVLVRPRTGGFVYDAADRALTLATVEQMLRLNVSAIAVGALTPSGHLDNALLTAIAEMTRPNVQLVMHRAFDLVVDPMAALEQLITLGFQRVLTSGGATGNACSNANAIKRLIQQAAGRITILPGGGVNVHNAQQIIEQAGCRELHGSFRQPLANSHAGDAFGAYRQVDASAIAQVRRYLGSLAGQA